MREYNNDRVVFYGRNDLAAGHFKDRVINLLSNPEAPSIESINDAIEAYQCKLTVEKLPELFDETSLNSMRKASSRFFGDACQYINQTMERTCLEEQLEAVEAQYCHLFWEFLDGSGASRKTRKGELKALLNRHPECIGDVLELKNLVNAHGSEVRDALLENPRITAELVIGRMATKSSSKTTIALPSELTNDDLDSIMRAYLHSDRPNPSYVKVLATWPSSFASGYKPSPDTTVLAQKTERKNLDDLFAEESPEVIRLCYGTGACIDEQQKPCKGIVVDGHNVTHTFSGKWLGQFVDFPTIMNNCIHVFDYVNPMGIMTMPARAHEESALMKAFGVHVLGEYSTTHAFLMRNGLAIVETETYSDFLRQHGTRLESALEWVFNEYFEDEFGIKGFSLSLPVEEATWLDKCKSIGPEIERAVKAYAVYAKRGKIDDAYFPYESVKNFQELPSLGENKYVVAGEHFEQHGFPLFSDQSLLAYVEGEDTEGRCFFELMQRQVITRTSYYDNLQPIIDRLLDERLVTENDQTGRLEPTLQAHLIGIVWKEGVLPLKFCDAEVKRFIGELVSEGVLTYWNALFTPDEAAYLSYVFNDASFTNSLGLRNRYDHAHGAIKDPNSDTAKNDYHQLLAILIAITIKINEELQDKTGRGGPSTFIDWPMFEINVNQTATQLGVM